MEPTRLIYVHNLLEDIIDTLRTFNIQEKLAYFKKNFSFYSQAQIINIISQYPGREKYYFIFLHQIEECYIQYVCRLFEIQRHRIEILVPKISEGYSFGSISLTLREDKQLFKTIMDLPKFDLASYCISDEFLDLYDILKDKANPFQFTTRQNWHKVKRSGTKPGIRELIDTLKDPRVFMPKGKIFYKSQTSFDEAVSFMTSQLREQGSKGLVVKTEKLCGGLGVVIIKKQQIQGLSEKQLQCFVRGKVDRPYWKCFDIVVEEYIETDLTIGPPFIEVNVNKEGHVSFVWLCSMIMANQNQFQGIECGKQIYQKQLYDEMVYIGQVLGKVYSSLGYWGNVAIDFMIDKNGTVYVGESNVRRSWPIYMHNFAERIYGKGYNDHHLKNVYVENQKLVNSSTQQVIERVQSLGLNYTKGKGQGIIITSGVQCLKDKFFLFSVIAKSIQEANQMERKIKQSYL